MLNQPLLQDGEIMISDTQCGLTVPCLHRIHSGTPKGSHAVHYSIGMSLDIEEISDRLKRLNSKATEMELPDNSVLVTFDDGWTDPNQLVENFHQLKKLQPVLFLTVKQLLGDTGLLPLPRLYAWCDAWSINLESISDLGITREWLKSLPEETQHNVLDALNIPSAMKSSEVLQPEIVAKLIDDGWIVGSHAHDHHDLRFDDLEELEIGLKKALDVTTTIGGVPWLAWPEGRCTELTCKIASKVGFTKQFGLNVEAGIVEHPSLIQREIWS